MSQPPSVLILAVDDEPLILDLMVGALEEGGYSVVTAANCAGAVSVLDQQHAELGGVVTDVNLGRGPRTGWDIGHHARTLNPSIPVVYVSGDSAHEWSAHGVPNSVLLSKPFTPADLVVALASLRQTA